MLVTDTRHLEVELPRSARAAKIARAQLRNWCAARVDDDQLRDADLLVTELVTNALLHGRGRITLRGTLDEHRVLVEVSDEGGGFQRALRDIEFSAVGGWGLQIVDDVASRWGVHDGSTHVWFELERSGPRLIAPD